MAIKIKRRREDEPETEEVPEVAQADEILVASAETFSWLQDNRNLVMGAVGALLIGIVVVSTVRDAGERRQADQARAVFAALDVATAEVGDGATYAGLAEREAALAAAAGEASGIGGALANDAALLGGRAALMQGDAASALQQYQAAAGPFDGTPEGAVVEFGVATAHAANGDLAQGLAVLDGLAERDGYALSARVWRARLIDTYGEPRAAWEAYTGLVDEFAGVTDTYPFEDRATQLAIELGIDDNADAEDEG